MGWRYLDNSSVPPRRMRLFDDLVLLVVELSRYFHRSINSFESMGVRDQRGKIAASEYIGLEIHPALFQRVGSTQCFGRQVRGYAKVAELVISQKYRVLGPRRTGLRLWYDKRRLRALVYLLQLAFGDHPSVGIDNYIACARTSHRHQQR